MLAFPVYGKPFLLLRAALISHGDLAIWHQEPEKGAASAAGKAAKGVGSAAVGKEGLNKMSKKAKDAAKGPGKTVHNATDGKGLLGFGQNAAKGAREKMTGVHTSESLQNQSNLANSNSGRNEAKDPRGAAKASQEICDLKIPQQRPGCREEAAVNM